MTWDNYGSYWHVDHIYPHSKLPYDSMDHPNFLKAWALNNLQPLEAIENMKKSNKILDTIDITEYTNTTE
jgi:5-methylcytosine-specific restriction endonuclease McrA